MTSNTTSHVAVWAQLEGLKGDELTAWRMNGVENRATVKERNLDTLPLPLGWFMWLIQTSSQKARLSHFIILAKI